MTPEPLDTARVRELLHGRDLAVTQVDENTWMMPRPNALYRLTLRNPQVLQLGAQWRGVATDDSGFRELRDAVLECNSTRTAPKSFVIPLDDNRGYSVVGECNSLLLSGMTQDQFLSIWESALTAISSFLHMVEKRLPHLVTWKGELD